MTNDMVKLIDKLVNLAREVENDESLSIEIYSVVLRIMEYSNESISRSVQLRIHMICYEGIIRVSNDEKLITKLRIDLTNMMEENDGIYTAPISDIS